MGVLDGRADRLRQLAHVDDHLLLGDGGDRVQRDDVIAGVLDVDEDLRTPAGSDFADGAEVFLPVRGEDLIADLDVDMRNYRAQVEHELRSKLLRLRQQGASQLSHPAGLLALCVDSVTTFCVLGRHALTLGGKKPNSERRAVIRQLAEILAADMKPFEILLDIREDLPGAGAGDVSDPGELFAQYLVCINRLIAFVDGLNGQG